MSFSESMVRTSWAKLCAGHTVITLLRAVQDPLLERTLGQHLPLSQDPVDGGEGQGGKKVLLG